MEGFAFRTARVLMLTTVEVSRFILEFLCNLYRWKWHGHQYNYKSCLPYMVTLCTLQNWAQTLAVFASYRHIWQEGILVASLNSSATACLLKESGCAKRERERIFQGELRNRPKKSLKSDFQVFTGFQRLLKGQLPHFPHFSTSLFWFWRPPVIWRVFFVAKHTFLQCFVLVFLRRKTFLTKSQLLKK